MLEVDSAGVVTRGSALATRHFGIEEHAALGRRLDALLSYRVHAVPAGAAALAGSEPLATPPCSWSMRSCPAWMVGRSPRGGSPAFRE